MIYSKIIHARAYVHADTYIAENQFLSGLNEDGNLLSTVI